MNPFSFVSAAPAVKVADLASYRACLVEYEAHIARLVALYGATFAAPAPVDTAPRVIPPVLLKDGKGPCEIEWLRRTGKKSVRFTSAAAASYPDKESYCKALCDGTAHEAPMDAEGETETVPRFESPDTVPPLF